jgi:hypothetical protein
MKYFVIILTIGMATLSAHNDAFGWCDQNDDWLDAPCYAPYQIPSESQERKDWEKYYSYKGSEWMDSKKLELIHAIQTDTLDEWIDESDDHSHENVYVYYSIFDNLEEYKISPDVDIKLTSFVLYFQEEDFTTQGPNHNILVLEQGESAAVTIHVKNNDDIPHRITLQNPDSDSNVFSSFVFEPKEMLVLPNDTNSTKLYMTIANKTDTHTTFVTFLGQSDSFGMRGLGFYLAIEKEDREIDYEFIDRSMRAGLPGGAFPDLDTDISEHEAEMSISNGFGSPRYIPEEYKFQGMDGWESKRFVYSKPPLLTESTGFQQFWDEGGILIIYGIDGPNVNNTASLPFRVAQNEGQQVMINGLMGDAVEKHTRTVAYSNTTYDVPSDVYFFDDAKKASVFLRANIPLDELLKVAASIPASNAVSPNYFSEQGYEIFSVVEGAYQYNVPYKIIGSKLSSMDLDCDGTEIIIGLESSDGGILVVNIPRKMLDAGFNNYDAEFILILDGKEIAFDEIYSDAESRTLKIPFSKGSQVLEIIITQLISQDPKSQVTCGKTGQEESPYYELRSPLKQFEYGISADKIQCKEGLILVIKSSDRSPTCVRPETKQNLIDRGWAKLIEYEIQNNYDEIRNHPTVKAFYAKYPNTIEEIRSDHISYVAGSDDGFKVRMKLYFDEKHELDHIDFHCYFQREHQNDVPESFILRYLKDFECEKRPTLAVVIIPYGSANPESQPNLIPEEITVVLGKNSTVHWTNNDVVPSTLTSDSLGWSTGMIKPGESAYVMFNETGVYPYHGEPHPWKVGKVIVLAE